MGGTIGIIPARAGSQRLPGKNIRPMAGRPMIDWTFQAALAATTLDRLVVTSDDAAVLSLAAERGIEAVRRPAELAGSDASVIDAVEHALNAVGGAWNTVVLLQPTSPLRLARDIDGAVELCRSSGAPAVLGVSPLAKPATFHDRLDGRGRLTGAPDLDDVVVINGAVYVARVEALRRARTFRVEGALGWLMPPENAWDVDDLADFLACEARLMIAAQGIL